MLKLSQKLLHDIYIYKVVDFRKTLNLDFRVFKPLDWSYDDDSTSKHVDKVIEKLFYY